jgi:hypothetical protein
MRRFAVLTLIVASLTALVWAEESAPKNADAARLLRFQRDQDLIEQLVDGAVDLADEPDPLRRAKRCNELADQVAQEIRRAGVSRDGARAKELGGHLRVLLESGVADNFRKAHGTGEGQPASQRKILEYSKLVKEKMNKMEAEFDTLLNEDGEGMKAALDSMRQGREEVERAIEGKKKAITEKP